MVKCIMEIPTHMNDQIEKLSKKVGIPKSGIIKTILAEYLDEHSRTE